MVGLFSSSSSFFLSRHRVCTMTRKPRERNRKTTTIGLRQSRVVCNGEALFPFGFSVTTRTLQVFLKRISKERERERERERNTLVNANKTKKRATFFYKAWRSLKATRRVSSVDSPSSKRGQPPEEKESY